MLDTVLGFLSDHSKELGAAGGLVAVILFLWAILKWPFKRDKPTQLAPETIDQIKPPQAKDGPALTVAEFIRLRRALKADLEQDLAEADDAEKAQLRARIAELESQIANPDAALAEARKRIADLERLLDREANHIGGDRIARAKAALEQGDYSLADDTFAEIESRNELTVQETARAADGRGEVAEAEVRWQDASKAYQRAAQLDPSYRTLKKAHEFTHRAGDYATALRLGERLIDAAEREGDQPNIAMAKNDHALTLRAQGRYDEAERCYREALEIDRATLGERHPDYAIHLNNLGAVVLTQERYEEAEKILSKALEITREVLGDDAKEYGQQLSNLANALQALGRYDEAERLYRKALEITRRSIGNGHPFYAILLNNLAEVMRAQARYQEAEYLLREALEIDRATIGIEHHSYAIRITNLALALVKLNRVEEARFLFEQALAIFRATLPANHPHIGAVEGQLNTLPDD